MVIAPHTYEVLSRSKGVNRYPLSASVRPIYRIKSFGRHKLFVLHKWRGVSARENRGLETAGSRSRYGNRNLWEAEPSKVFCLPFNAHLEKKISYSFLYYVKGHRCDVIKTQQICRSLASCISRKFSRDQSESGQMSSNGITSSSQLCLYVRFYASS